MYLLKENERWIDGYENRYCVSSEGYVYSFKPMGKYKMIGHLDGSGYRQVFLRKDNKSKQPHIHRLIAMAFLGNIDNKPTVNHINGIKEDNRVENLEWATISEQHRHAFKLGLRNRMSESNKDALNKAKGKKCPFTLNEASDIVEMKYNYNLSNAELARLVGCQKSTIKRLIKNEIKNFREECDVRGE